MNTLSNNENINMNNKFDRSFVHSNNSTSPIYLSEGSEWAYAAEDGGIAVSQRRKAAMLVEDGSELLIQLRGGIECYGIPNERGMLIWSPCYIVHASTFASKPARSSYVRAYDGNFNNVDTSNLSWFPIIIEDAESIRYRADIRSIEPNRLPVSWEQGQGRSITLRNPLDLNVTSWLMANMIGHHPADTDRILLSNENDYINERGMFRWMGTVATLDSRGVIVDVGPKMSYGIDAFHWYVENYVDKHRGIWQEYLGGLREGFTLPILVR